MENPYEPLSISSKTSSTIALYSPGHVAWATFLGTPIAGAILMAFNYFRLLKPTAGNISLLVGSLLTVAVLAAAFLLPDDFPNSVLPLTYTVGMYQAAKILQGEEFREHLARGGDKASAWFATGIGILCSIIVVVLIFAILFTLPGEWMSE